MHALPFPARSRDDKKGESWGGKKDPRLLDSEAFPISNYLSFSIIDLTRLDVGNLHFSARSFFLTHKSEVKV